MLVRDAPGGVEVFLMQRRAAGVFGGLHVFPGGKLDSGDAEAGWAQRSTGPGDAEASRILGVTRGGLAYWVACIRECFEEAGVLLADEGADALLEWRGAAQRARFADWRARLNGREPGVFRNMCEAEGLRLATQRLAYVAHWITPQDQKSRFSTRFFVARAPAAQSAIHDGRETVGSRWMRPEDALAGFRRGELALISPTFRNLEAICGYPSADALLEDKRRLPRATGQAIRPRTAPGGAWVDEVIAVDENGREVG